MPCRSGLLKTLVPPMQPHILVCDHHDHVTRVVSLWLRKAGFDVTTFEDALDAWDALQTNAPAAVLCGAEMPYMDGQELCRRLRADYRFRDLPVILMAERGNDLNESALRRDLQVSAVISKPLNPLELIFLVQRAVGTTEEETAS